MWNGFKKSLFKKLNIMNYSKHSTWDSPTLQEVFVTVRLRNCYHTKLME